MFFIGTCIINENKRDIVFDGIKEVKQEKGISIRHFRYSNCQEMLSNYIHNLDILILEIDIYDINYLSIISSIHEIDDHVDIIIIPSKSIKNNTVYNLRGITYFFNNINKYFVINLLNEFIQKNNKVNSDIITLSKKNQLVKIYKHSIKYIETETHTRSLIVYYKDKSHKVKCTISDIESKLNSKLFFRCHKSYIININRIIKIDNRLAQLDDGNYIPIGRNKVKELKYILSSSYKNKLL